MTHKQKHWFPDAVLYQIYPRSFYDASGDGIGDLKGIISKLDYLNGADDSLGVTAIWLSPFYPSPMADFGYDVADYCAVDPVFGTLRDFDALITQAHQRGIKVLIDLVPNHTSDKHPWFIESCSSRTNPRRDWYIWRDPKPDGSAPNNWLSAFDGSAWQYDEATEQYYLHTFLKEQPDLNWHNPKVRKAMQDVMRFWLKRGVDGFRVDAVYWLAKDQAFRDDPLRDTVSTTSRRRYDSLQHRHSRKQKELFNYLHELTEVTHEFGDILLITEAYPDTGSDAYLEFYEKVASETLAPFNFDGIFLPWKAGSFRSYIDKFQQLIQPQYLPVYAMSNHDSTRIVTRIGKRAARAEAVLQLSLPGLPIIYYGDEIGMADVPVPERLARDPLASESRRGRNSRDPERTPMQWSPGNHAGFSRFRPWLPIGKNYKSTDVETERNQQGSMLRLYQSLIRFRMSSDAMRYGTYTPVPHTHKNLYCFIREYELEKLAVVINFSRLRSIRSPFQGEIMISTHASPGQRLRPLEGRIVKLQ